MPTLKSPDTDTLEKFVNAFTCTKAQEPQKQAAASNVKRLRVQNSGGFQWLHDLTRLEMAAHTVNQVQEIAEEVLNDRADREFTRLLNWLNKPSNTTRKTEAAGPAADTKKDKPDTSETLAQVLTRIANSPAAGKDKRETEPAQLDCTNIWSQILPESYRTATNDTDVTEDDNVDITGFSELMAVSLSALEALTLADIERIANDIDAGKCLKSREPKSSAKRAHGKKARVRTNQNAPTETQVSVCGQAKLGHTKPHAKPQTRRIPSSDETRGTTHARNDARSHLSLSEIQATVDPSIRTLDELKIDEAIALATGDPSVKLKISAKADEIESLNAAEAERIRQKIRARRQSRAFEREARPSASRILLEEPQQIARSLDLDISDLVEEIEERKRKQRPSHRPRQRSKKTW